MSDPTHSKLSWISFFKSILGLWCIRRYRAASCKHFCLCIVIMFDRASTADWHHEEFRRFWFFSTWYTLSTFDNPSKNGNKSSSSVSVMSSNQEFTPTYNTYTIKGSVKSTWPILRYIKPDHQFVHDNLNILCKISHEKIPWYSYIM